jgi:glycerol kinase
MIVRADETEALARSVADSAGVVVVPALSGLGAPHWRAEARGCITGLSFAATRAHVVRAALEAISHQTQDLAAAFAADGAEWTTLRIDGGMSANDWLAQDIADLVDLPVARPDFVETTALGAAMLAAVGAELHGSLEDACAAMIGGTRRFEPAMAADTRAARLAAWEKALVAV